MGFGRKVVGQGFGRKGLAEQQPSGRVFGGGNADRESSPFQLFFAQLQSERDLSKTTFMDHIRQSHALHDLSAEDRGALLADLADRPGIYDGGRDGASASERAAFHAHSCIYS